MIEYQFDKIRARAQQLREDETPSLLDAELTIAREFGIPCHLAEEYLILCALADALGA